jgi:hypothetical protein
MAQTGATAASGVGVITASLIFGAFVLKLVDLVKHLIEGFRGEWNGFLTLTMTWVVGFIAIWLFIQTGWGQEIRLGEQTLDQINTSGKIVFALAAPAVAALLYDAKKAVDDSDTASTPRLTSEAEAGRKARLGVTSREH